MRRYSFRGGVHPAEYKELSRDIAITEAKPSSGTVAIPVTMGGAPNTPTVKPGDHVTKGQVIADSTAFMSAPVHASLSGTVKEIVSCLGPSNKQEQCIVIESDGTDSTAYMPPLDPFSCDRKDAVQRIRDAGIVGMGGASFPTHVKFSPAPGTTIEYVLLNAAECEPYLTVDYRTMKESPEKVIDGFSIAVHLSGGTGIIALEENKADLVDVLNDAIGKAGKSDTIAVRVMKTKYPQGSEKTITLALLGREVPSGGLPANIGCLIINVNTACAISDAFREGKPLIERSFTVSGGGCAAPKNLRVPVGTKVSDLGDLVAMKHPDTKKIIAGGPMMGFAVPSTEFPVTKGTSGVLFLTEKETFYGDETPCISCASCIKACPMHLAPVLMIQSLKAGSNTELAKRYGLMDCIECGCCSYVCPAHIRLVERIRNGKNIVRLRAAKKAQQKPATVAGGK